MDVSTSAISIRLETLTIEPGDTMTCLSTGWTTDHEFAIASALGHQEAGGHHITIYWRTPGTGALAPHRCNDAEMATWNFVAGTGGEPGSGDDQSPPDGLAFHLPANAEIVVQVHYINTDGVTRSVNDSLDIQLVDPATTVGYTNMFVVNDGAFEVPARTHFRRTTECTVAQPLSTVLLLGHMHGLGARFSYELVHTDGTTEMLYDETWTGLYTSHPPVVRWPIDAPLELVPGMHIRQTCEWNNTTDTPALFPTEMCDGVMYYFPDVGEGQIVCDPTLVEEGPVP